MASKAITLKLLIDNKSKKVLFAEAGKEFVDFVFSLLTLPIGAVVRLLAAGAMHGSIGRLYQSVECMGETYMLPHKDKADLLAPKVHVADTRDLLLLEGAPESSFAGIRLYTCSGNCCTATVQMNTACPQCKSAMATDLAFAMPSAEVPEGAATAADGGDGGGYVKGVITYMITDNLDVSPMSAISSITLINRFSLSMEGVELAEKVVSLGMDEGLALLKAALQSNTVLTDVFLMKKASLA